MYMISKSHCFKYVILACATKEQNSIDAQNHSHTFTLNNLCMWHYKFQLFTVLDFGP